MSRSIQLQIPKPCHEDWDKMRPEEKGRHCAACEKVVVDFTRMSDAEVFQFFSKSSSSVCGRIGSNQLNRKLAPPLPPLKSRGTGWPWLLAGMLVTTYEAGSYIMERGATLGEMAVRPEKVCNTVMGDTVMRTDIDTSALEQTGERHEIDTVEEVGAVVFGGIGVQIIEDDSVTRDSPPADSVITDSLPDVQTYVTGGLAVRSSVLDTVKQFIADSLGLIGIKGKDEVQRLLL